MTKTGIGLRSEHFDDILTQKPAVGFLEGHSENYFGGGAPRHYLRELRALYPITLHGVGLSLGRADGLNKEHLKNLKSLIDEIDPMHVSEHLTWSAYSHMHVPDLLPLPFTKEALNVFCQHVEEMQETLGRQILVENPSNYLVFEQADMKETDFLNQLAEKSGCKILLDINNIYVSAHNLGYDPLEYIREINADSVGQFHLAGYEEVERDGEIVYIDTHGKPVYDGVWALYAIALERFGDTPTLLEWDLDIPALKVLEDEAKKADVVRGKIFAKEKNHAVK